MLLNYLKNLEKGYYLFRSGSDHHNNYQPEKCIYDLEFFVWGQPVSNDFPLKFLYYVNFTNSIQNSQRSNMVEK